MTKAGSGRPVRFFALLMIGWIAIRAASLSGWPPETTAAVDQAEVTPATIRPVFQTVAAETTPLFLHTHPDMRPFVPFHLNRSHRPNALLSLPAKIEDDSIPVDLSDFITFTVAFSNRSDGANAIGDQVSMLSPPVVPLLLTADPATDRWHLSSWAFWRAGSGASSAPDSGRLGGSQVGARLDFDLTPGNRGRIAAYSRMSAALNRPTSPEAAIGLAYQPNRRVPLTLAAERRVSLGEGGRNATALYVAGGFGPAKIGPVLKGEGYAQAGMVGFNQRDLFIDGKMSLYAPLARTPLNLGASLSGGAQPGVSRVDFGPEAHVRLPLARLNARLGIEWREQIAGNAAPRSGIALTLATDF